MPWEKTFDIDDSLDKATRVFWQKGYQGTSMADLIEAMGINKGSLYNAFGSKKELFDRVLMRYDQQNRAANLARLRALDDPVAAIKGLFDGTVTEAQADPNCLGCFIINTAQDMPNQPPETVKVVNASLQEIEAFFYDMIVLGQERGDIPGSCDPKVTARGLFSLLVGLRVLARNTTDQRGLQDVRTSALHLIGH